MRSILALTLVAALAATLAAAPAASAQSPVFVNELHYDNAGTDAAEAIEIAASEGTDLTAWQLVLYNGSGGAPYDTRTLAGEVGESRVLVVEYPANGIQNGAPDAIALVDADGVVRQFVSYEGVVTAVGGPADGRVSADIGVLEDGSEAGTSLQLTGSGAQDDDFAWTGPRAPSFGALNEGQTFDGASGGESDGDPGGIGDAGSCEDASTAIGAVQGSGAVSPLAGRQATVEGVVVGDFEGETGAGHLDGVFVQDPHGDGAAVTSDGLFVFLPGAPELDAGDAVRAVGTVTEYFGLTELTDVTGLTICGSDEPLPQAEPLELPAEPAARERLEGMRVVASELSVTENRNVDDFGELLLSAGGVLSTPTEIAEPGAAAQQVQAQNVGRSVILDDGRDGSALQPIPYITPSDTVRRGDTAQELEGVLSYGFDAYRIQPTSAVTFTERNPRPAAPPEVRGDFQVASLNVLNYFVTFGGEDDRGAPNAAELEQQEAKIVAAIDGLGAEVVALEEIQDTTDEDGSPDTAVQTLVTALNEAAGSERWAAVPAPQPYGNTDEIRVAVIYQPAVVELVGASVALADPAFGNARVPVAQTFRAAGETLTVVANHFKSRSCGGAAGANADRGDGQGCFNADRVAQAQAMLRFVEQVRAASGDDDVLVTGDLNSYSREEPIDVLTDGGLVSLLGRAQRDAERYSYVFDGAQGVLDHALATASLAAKVEGAGAWHVNADEPDTYQYTGPAAFYTADPFRASDHDAVLVGIHGVDEEPEPEPDVRCRGRRATIVGGPGRDRIEGTRGDDVIAALGGRDRIDARRGDDLVCGGDGDDRLDGGPGDDALDGGDGRDRLDGGHGDDRLWGGDGDDILDGGPGDDRPDGGAGRDRVERGR